MLSDIFIANIQEISTENDYFNLNFLISKGGIMPYTWVQKIILKLVFNSIKLN